MEQQTLKITGVLSDPTRFSIYQYVTKQHREVTVQEIADVFNIHPNVARLHLTKLEDVKLLFSVTKKTGNGGRPSRYYQLSDEVVSLQFPYRDYKLLSEIAIQSLASLGKEGEQVLIKTGEKFGYMLTEDFVRSLEQNIHNLTAQEKIHLIERITLNQGLNPEINYDKEKNEVVFRIYNCTFKEIAKTNHAICKMHYAQIHGMFKYFFGDVTLKQQSNLLHIDDFTCTYKTVLLPKA
ncbi:helix-turn-helix transcriptional regulator [Evansella halocellulosilytica]|uniref:helix-turn-helix transcriptional regulator n=1 Tax=Evansella halocellulosilytica TaxID=2011013 RepID=UPI000BB99BB7|nr:helix-turn-helix domain-containing protein [Evansella halocellulosilytica]